MGRQINEEMTQVASSVSGSRHMNKRQVADGARTGQVDSIKRKYLRRRPGSPVNPTAKRRQERS